MSILLQNVQIFIYLCAKTISTLDADKTDANQTSDCCPVVQHMRSSNNKAYIFVTFSFSPLLRICFVFYQEFIRVCEYVRGMLHSLPLFALMCSKQALESPAVRAYCWSR